ncbi:pilus assembly protein TadG-related protein [Bradyrhizobium genosp. P]|uniref:pilus assembly protein TadG-related protein n=1 Tax=Bradyrhizobium genosp. P TaxID=83641 RepID=UPI003CF63EAD
MRNMLRCRRGSVAFATVVALIPLIGVVALGAEGGAWYVTKQHAQNAADAAAYSSGLWLACSLAPSTCTADTQTMAYRGKELAAQNGFCNAGVTSYPGGQCINLPSGTSRTVTITPQGTDSVQATVTQTQPAYLAKVLGLSTVTIGATAIAQVKVLANPCVLSLSDPVAFQGSTTVKAPNCGLSSNSTASNAMNFTGNGLDVSNVKSISGAGGCAQTAGSQCSKVITFAPPVVDPLSGLNSAILSLTKADFSGGACGSTLKAYGPTTATTSPCYNNGFPAGNQTLNGVYFFTGNVTISGSVTVTGTATLILLGPKFLSNGDKGATLTFNGNPTIQITALSSVSSTQVPTKLATSSILSLLSGLLIYDPETTSKNQTVTISGNTTSSFTGITYLPNADVVYQGSTVSSTCVEVIAKGVTLSGNSNFDNSGCPASSKIVSQYVRLVQ